jgi:hypothetical protein
MNYFQVLVMLIFLNASCFSQSKKEIIVQISEQNDSLRKLLEVERINAVATSKEYDSMIVELDTRNANSIELLNKYQLEIVALKAQLAISKTTISELNNEVTQLKDSVSELISIQNNTSDSSDDEDKLRKQVEFILSQIKKYSASDLVAQKISASLLSIYEAHNRFIDSLSSTDDEGSNMSEFMNIDLIRCNGKFIIYEIGVEGFYGGAHLEDYIETHIYDLSSGERIANGSVIIASKRSEFLALLNSKLKKLIPEMHSCLDSDEYDDILFTEDNLNEMRFDKNDIIIEYYTSHATRACNPNVILNKEEIKSYFISGIFD